MFLTKRELIKELEDIPDDAVLYIYGIKGPHFIEFVSVKGENNLGYNINTNISVSNLQCTLQSKSL
jgi:hypothetical protein